MFKQRKNKAFNYQPRFSNENENDSSSSDTGTTDFVSKWKEVRGNKRKVRGGMSFKMLVLVLVLLLICMYILDSKFG
ncbi:hypothetical protein [Flavivirga eckloniae]|uniref:Riboflavin synthase subunit beta n=1 Tax=Flavivirga eckloniae TaxID=1803846 RepID=A0A2K9PMV4_9FLAO|nr:hypothetical protein [Flavivirga eckloniae]AUP78356.1 hypothetical protein C1H87_06390 [Flavivirga eckloniae]